jgi:hypothetical protein
MQYQNLGASLTRNDLFYLLTLAKSLKLDIDTAKAAGTLTVSQAAVINDKIALAIDAANTLNTLTVQIAPADQGLFDQIGALMNDVNSGINAIKNLTPTPDSGPVAMSAYRPNTPFVTAPATIPGSVLAPAKAVVAKLNVPIQTTSMTVSADGKSIDVTAQYAGGAGYSAAASTAPAKTGLPLGLLAVVGIAAYFIANR